MIHIVSLILTANFLVPYLPQAHSLRDKVALELAVPELVLAVLALAAPEQVLGAAQLRFQARLNGP